MTEPDKINITREYHQVEDDRWRSDEITREGACFGLSIWWIIKNAQGEDYWAWLKTPEGAEKIRDAMDQQKSSGKLLDQTRFAVAQKIIKGYVPKLEVPRSEKPVQDHTVSFEAGYYYISMEGRYPDKNGGYPASGERSAHGIAAYFSKDGPSKYFDANLGEGQVNDGDEVAQQLTKIVRFYRIKDWKILKSHFVLQG